jgi:hypothetical protein
MASLLSAAREEKSAKVMNVSLHVYLIYRRVSAPYITIHQNHPLRFTPRNPTRQKLTDLRPQDPPPWPIWIFAGNDKNQIETTKKSNARRFPNSKTPKLKSGSTRFPPWKNSDCEIRKSYTTRLRFAIVNWLGNSWEWKLSDFVEKRIYWLVRGKF